MPGFGSLRISLRQGQLLEKAPSVNLKLITRSAKNPKIRKSRAYVVEAASPFSPVALLAGGGFEGPASPPLLPASAELLLASAGASSGGLAASWLRGAPSASHRHQVIEASRGFGSKPSIACPNPDCTSFDRVCDPTAQPQATPEPPCSRPAPAAGAQGEIL